MKTGIHIESGKSTALTQRLVTKLSEALMVAIAGGREETAKAIARELGALGGVNGTQINSCYIGDGK